MKTSTMPFLLTLLLLLNVRSNAFIKGIPCGKMSIYRSYSPSRYEQETTAWIMVKRRRSIGGNLRSIQEASVLWESYNVALERNPLLVKSLTAGVILGLADFTGQAVENLQSEGDNKGIDFARAARFSIFGLVLQGKESPVTITFADCSCFLSLYRSALEPFLLSSARRSDSADTRALLRNQHTESIH